MSIVDRLIEVQSWSTSRKTFLLGVFVCFLTVFNGLFVHVMLAPLPWVNVAYPDWVTLVMFTNLAISTFAAWLVDRRGQEGRWTFYLLAGTFTPVLAALIWGFGSASTALLIFVPLSVLNVVVLFDDRIGRFTIYLATSAMIAGFVLPLTGWLPYAPALREGQLDLLGEPRFVLAMGAVAVVSGAAIFAVALAEVSAGRRTSERLDAAQKLIARYLPREVADDILQGRMTDADGHHRRRLTVFFSDLVGFSDLAEELEPEDLALVLNEYFSEMLAIAHRHNGTVDELLGDALLVLFGAPRATTDKEHALNAVHMAADMHVALATLNARWQHAGITEPLAVRMGINTGVVTVGNFGSPERLTYTALGKHVNLAARLQAIAEPGATVVSYATYLLIKDEVECTPLGPQVLKGITKPVDAFRAPSPSA